MSSTSKPADDDSAGRDSGQTASGPLPLSRNASRALVIASILFIVAASAGGAWLILDLARSGPPPSEAVPASVDTTDTAATDTAATDTAATDTAATPVP